MYTWQLEEWPRYRFDRQVAEDWTQQAHYVAQRVTGALEVTPEEMDADARIDLMVNAALETSAIEGEILNREDVRSSIRNHFLPASEREPVHDPVSAGIARLVLEVRDRYQEPLTKELLHHWCRLVLPDSLARPGKSVATGRWRDHPEPMQIVSGTVDRPTIHFEAPPSSRVAGEMADFLTWFNGESYEMPGVARAAIAHLWFETIHPYEDGNGRVGRAIADVAVSQMLEQPVLMSLAVVFSKHRKEYYRELNRASMDTLDITPWVDWFGARVVESLDDTMAVIRYVVEKTRFWQRAEQESLNSRQEKLIRRMLGDDAPRFEDGINAGKYANLTRCSKATATRDLQDLVAKGLLVPVHSKGRHARYRLGWGNEPLATI